MLTPEQEDEKTHNIRIAFGNGLGADIWEKFQKRFNIPQVNELYSSTEGNITLFNVGKPLVLFKFFKNSIGLWICSSFHFIYQPLPNHQV
jgi:hypothetical protein